MTPEEEAAYIAGGKAVFLRMMRKVLSEVDDGPEKTRSALVVERAEAVAILRVATSRGRFAEDCIRKTGAPKSKSEVRPAGDKGQGV